MKNSPSYALLMDQLKAILKRKKIKYTEIAKELEMSESSIKRLMSSSDGNLSKIEAICEVAGISFMDLVILTKDERPKDFNLTKEQADFFAKNTNYFYFFELLYEQRHTIKEVKKKFGLNDKSVMKYLKKLEDLGLCERHPNDKIVWLVSGSIGIPEMNDLGKHLMKTSLSNLKDLVIDGKGNEELKKREGTFRISEIYLKPETAKQFFDELFQLTEKMAQTSDREERVFGKEELVLYTGISSMLPVRLYYEDVPNI